MKKQIDISVCMDAVNNHFYSRQKLLTSYVSKGISPADIASDVMKRITSAKKRLEEQPLKHLTEYGVNQWRYICEEFHDRTRKA